MLLCALAWAFAAPRVFAAAVVLETAPGSSGADGSFAVNAYLDTEGESVNGIEGKILLPGSALRIREVRAGNSSVALWLEAPRPKAGAMPFAGMIPGGVSGPKLFLFSMILNGQFAGTAILEADILKALKNDGMGTRLPVRKTSISIAAPPVSGNPPGAAFLEADLLEILKSDGTGNGLPTGYGEDVSPPDVFRVAFGRDDGMFGGNYFIAFSAQDKGSGIGYYEVWEDGYAPVRAVSPYFLKNKKMDKEVLVTAFDGNGNARTVVAYPPGWRSWYRRYGLAFTEAGFLVLFLLICVRMLRKKWRKS